MPPTKQVGRNSNAEKFQKSWKSFSQRGRKPFLFNPYNARIKAWKEKIEIEKAKRIIILSKAELRTYYKEALLLEGILLINYMVKEITLYNDRVVITFNSPLRTSPDDSQDFSFYEEKTYMDVIMRNRGTVERHNQLLILAV